MCNGKALSVATQMYLILLSHTLHIKAKFMVTHFSIIYGVNGQTAT